MIPYTVYDNATKRTIRTGVAMTEASANLQGSRPGTSVVLHASDPKTEIIENNVPVPRQPMRTANGLTFADKTTITANGSDMMTIHFVPPGAIAEVFLPPNLGLIQPPDGIVGPEANVQVTCTIPGIYQLKISHLTFLDFEVTFNAV